MSERSINDKTTCGETWETQRWSTLGTYCSPVGSNERRSVCVRKVEREKKINRMGRNKNDLVDDEFLTEKVQKYNLCKTYSIWCPCDCSKNNILTRQREGKQVFLSVIRTSPENMVR